MRSFWDLEVQKVCSFYPEADATQLMMSVFYPQRGIETLKDKAIKRQRLIIYILDPIVRPWRRNLDRSQYGALESATAQTVFSVIIKHNVT